MSGTSKSKLIMPCIEEYMNHKFKVGKQQGGMISGRDDALSDIIAGILLTAVIVAGIGMAAVFILSLGTPVDIPVLRVSPVNNVWNVALVHSGGDPLSIDEMRIMIDGVDRTDELFLYPGGDENNKKAPGEWSTFSVGDWLVSSVPCDEESEVQIIYTSPDVPTVIQTVVCQPGDIPPPPIADFTASAYSGYVPMYVSFTDQSIGEVTFWSWDFGDNYNSTDKNPVHTYINSGIFAVNLTVCNGGGCNSTENSITVFGFDDYIENESVFVYGSQLTFLGKDVTGEGSTIVITGDIVTDDIKGASIDVSNINVDGDLYVDTGTASFGSKDFSGMINISGDLTLWIGNRDIYGDVYVGGNFTVKEATIHNNVYVCGDLILGKTPKMDDDSRIYYAGSRKFVDTNFEEIPQGNYDENILAKCIYQETVPEPLIVVCELPSARSEEWYSSHNYSSGGNLASYVKIAAENSYSYSENGLSAQNVIIVAINGDISLDPGNGDVTGVLFAPNGKVIFEGPSFEGLVLAKDGFFVGNSNAEVTFVGINTYIPNSEDYPWQSA